MSDPGTCGFCGSGGGYLLDQGNESALILSSTYKDKAGALKAHPGAWDSDSRRITWCGACDEGLAHKFWRLSDHNLSAAIIATKLWTELDGPLWAQWEMDDDHKKQFPVDDPAVHSDKLRRESELSAMQRERVRRMKVEVHEQ